MRSPVLTTLSLTVAIAATLGLTACKQSEDPAKGGFFSGISNLADGTYEKRQQEKKEAVENEQDVNTQKQRELERAKAQEADVAADRASAEKKYAALSKEISALKAKLAKAKGNNSKLSKEIAALEASINMLKNDPATPEADKAKRLEQLRKQKEDLESQVDQAIKR